jgi:hypothetical protein
MVLSDLASLHGRYVPAQSVNARYIFIETKETQKNLRFPQQQSLGLPSVKMTSRHWVITSRYFKKTQCHMPEEHNPQRISSTCLENKHINMLQMSRILIFC